MYASSLNKQKDWAQDICLSQRAEQSMWLTTSECGMMYSSVIQQPIIVVISYEHTSSHLSSLGMEMCPVAGYASIVSLLLASALQSQKLPTHFHKLLNPGSNNKADEQRVAIGSTAGQSIKHNTSFLLIAAPLLFLN